MNLHDVRVFQRGDGAGLAHEARQFGRAGVLARQQHLQRNDPVQFEMARPVDDAGAPVADQFKDVVAGDCR
jgi:hypothetical protein